MKNFSKYFYIKNVYLCIKLKNKKNHVFLKILLKVQLLLSYRPVWLCNINCKKENTWKTKIRVLKRFMLVYSVMSGPTEWYRKPNQ